MKLPYVPPPNKTSLSTSENIDFEIPCHLFVEHERSISDMIGGDE